MPSPSSGIFQRGKFTDALLTYMSTRVPSPVLLGDHETPVGAGWGGDQAGSGTYIPSVTLTTMMAAPSGVIGDPLARRLQSSWRALYALQAVGGTRQQCEAAQDAVRPLFGVLHGTLWTCGQGGTQYKVLQSFYSQMGPVQRNDQTDPPTYECVDVLEVWLEKH